MLWRFLLVTFFSSSLCLSFTDIRHLEGSADFKSVSLHWKYGRSQPDPSGFIIKYCEDQAWGKYRCKKKDIESPLNNEIPTSSAQMREFVAEITGLRMSTNYTIEVTPITRASGSSFDRGRSIENQIMLQTKGFSARATKCLANSSMVEINTGPNFGGKIAVEGSEDPQCTSQGNRKSDQTSYSLNIDHIICGSEVINSSVRTFIVVQENLPILTHSTRRFMVVCNYVPETFTVRAGVNLPEYDEPPELQNVGQSVNEVDPSELFDSVNNIFDSRLSEDVGRALKLSATQGSNRKPQMWAHLVLMVILVMAAVVGLSCAGWHFIRQSRTQNRTGFMSPEIESSLQDSNEETEVSLSEVASECQPQLEENPVSLRLKTDLDTLDLHQDLLLPHMHLATDVMYDPLTCEMDNVTYENVDNLCYDVDIAGLSQNACIDDLNELTLATSSYHSMNSLSDLGPGISVDCDMLSMTPQMSYINDSLSLCPIVEDSIDQINYVNLACNSTLVSPDFNRLDLPMLVKNSSDQSLILDPSALPHLFQEQSLHAIELGRLEALTPTPMNLALSGLPIDLTEPLTTFSFETEQLNLDNDIDDVFESDCETLTDDSLVENEDSDLPTSEESNWKLGDGEGQIFPATSV